MYYDIKITMLYCTYSSPQQLTGVPTAILLLFVTKCVLSSLSLHVLNILRLHARNQMDLLLY